MRDSKGRVTKGNALHLTHGHNPQGNPSPTYTSWASMIQRTTNQKHPDYPYYSKLGVCPEWLDFSNFLNDMGERPTGTTLDRVEGVLGYSPGNCRWASPREQALNRKTTVWVTRKGITRCLKDWCRHLGLNYKVVHSKVNRDKRTPLEALGLRAYLTRKSMKRIK